MSILTLLSTSGNLAGQNVVPAASYCFDDGPVNLYISAPPNKTWTCSVAGVIANTGGGNAVFNPSAVPGPYPRVIIIHYQNPNYAGEPATPFDPLVYHYEYSVTITTPGAFTFNPLPDICETDFPLDLNPYVSDAGGTFAGPGVDAGGFFDPLAAGGGGDYSISYTYPATGCNDTKFQMVHVESVPIVTFFLPAVHSDVCITDGAFPLSGGAPGGGVYSGGVAVVGGNFDPSLASIGNNTITYTYTTATGCVGTATDIINVHDLPTIKAVSKTDFCAGGAGGSITVNNIDAGIDYILIDNATLTVVSTLSGAAGSNLTFSGLSAATYFIRASNQLVTCTTDYPTVTILSNPAPTVAPTAVDPDFCLGGSTQINANAVALGGAVISTYLWDNAIMITNSGISNPTTDADLVATTTFTVLVTDNKGCTASGSTTVTVYPLPVVSLTIPLANEEVCIDEPSFALSLGLPAGGTFSGVGVAHPNFNPAIALAGIKTITYTYTDALGCTNTATDNITVHALPVVGLNNLDPEQCDVDPSYTINGTPLPVLPTIGSFSFTGAPAGVADNGDGTAVFDPALTGLGTNTVTYTYTDANGCTASTSEAARVGTLIFINGLGPLYCQDSPDIPFVYSHWLNPVTDGVSSAPVAAAVTDTDDGSLDATFHPTLAGAGNHTVTYTFTDEIGCINIVSQNVNVALAVNANFIGLNAALAYCSGAADVTLTGNYAPGGTFSGPGGSITDNGNGTATFSPSVLAVGGPYSITYTFTNASGCTDTESKDVFILALPTANLAGSGTICATDPKALTATFTGTGPFSFSYTDGFSNFNVPGVPSPYVFDVYPVATRTYTITSVSHAGNVCTNVGAGNANVIVNPQVAITTQPVDVAVCETATAVFTIAATGVGLSYAWTQNGLAVGANSNILAINNVGPADDGSIIQCVVSSTCGGPLTSDPVILDMITTTSITTQPTGGIRCTGSSISMSTIAAGSNLTYQWMKNGFNMANIAGKISGTNTATLVILNLVAADAANYTCLVSGDCGSETSNPAILQVNNPIVITSQPNPIIACANTNITFSLTATGTNLSYQWYFDNGGGPALIPLATNNSYPINNIGAANVGNYYCVVSSPCGSSVQSNTVSLTIPLPTTLISSPAGITLCQGSSVNFSVSATGSNLNYQWRRNGVDMVDNAFVSGSLTANLSISPIAIADGANYSCLINGDCGSVTSAAALLVVEQSITINSQPLPLSLCLGNNATFTVNASGTNMTFQWQKNAVDIVGANNVFITLAAITALDAANYRCRITNACGDTYTNEVALIVNNSTIITQNPVNQNICEADPVAFSVVATGAGLSYQWYKDAVIIAGETNSTLSIANALLADVADYTCQVTGTCGSPLSAPGHLAVDVAPAITSHPLTATVCSGLPHSLVVLATGSNLTYQWVKDGVDIPGANNQVFNIAAFAVGDVGIYYCKITNNCGTINSNNASLTIGTATSVTNPVAVLACQNSDVLYSVVATGNNLTYQWLQDGAPMFDNATFIGTATSQLSILNAQPAYEAVYSCQVTGTCGTANSLGASLTVEELPVVTTQPFNITGCEGDNTTFSVTATGDNLSYSWLKDGLAIIPAETNPSLALSAIVAGDAGNYTCVVSNGCNSVNSNTASLTVNIPIVIVSSPADVTQCEGTLATFNVSATGTGLNYQWFKGIFPVVDGGAISGASTSTLLINGLVIADAGTYYCRVSNSCNAQVSGSAILTVNQIISITTQPLSQIGCPASALNIIALSTGNNLNYQWYKNGIASGPNNPVYPIASFAAGDAATYRCDISNSCGTVSTNDAIITLGIDTDVILDPVNEVRCIGEDVNFVINAAGSNLTYQWQKDGVDLVDGGNITASATNSLSITGIQLSDFGTYTCTATGNCGIVTSLGGTLTVLSPVVITTNPNSDTTCVGGTVTFNVLATGDNLNYSWQRNGAAIIPAETNSTLTIAGVTAADEAVYNCVISNTCNTLISTSADLVVYDQLVINTQPADQTLCLGANASFTVGITAPVNRTIAWYHNGVLLNNGGRVSGATSPTLNINAIDLADAGNYSCEISSSCGTLTSNIAALTIHEPLSFTLQPNDATGCPGSVVNLNVTVTGTPVTYQWLFGVAPVGTNNPAYSIAAFAAADAGNYTCQVSNICGTITSDIATVTEGFNTTLTNPVGITKCETENASFQVAATGSNLTYQWYQNGIALTDNGHFGGTLSDELTITNLTLGDAFPYHCEATGSCGNVISNIASLVVTERVSISVHPISISVLTGNSASFTVVANGDVVSYQWRKNGTDLVDGGNISGATTNNLVIANASAPDADVYTCFISGTCNNITSNPANLTVLTSSVITTQPVANVNKCEGESLNIFIVTSGSGHTYQWQQGGINLVANARIIGVNTSTLTINNLVVADQNAYTCLVDGVETSSATVLLVNPATLISTHPLSYNKCENDNVVFFVAAQGGSLSYQWQKDNIDIAGAITDTYSINPLALADDGQYRCVVTGTCGIKYSNPGSLDVHRNTAIVTQPLAVQICTNGSNSLTVAANGENLTYQWQKNGLNISASATVTGVNSNILVFTNPLTTDAGTYNCLVTGTCGTQSSNAVAVDIYNATQITVQPINQTRCVGDNVLFSIGALGNGLNYQWYYKGILIGGATASSYALASVAKADAGSYTCNVSGTCGTILSSPAVLTVNDLTVVNTQPADATICQGFSNTFSINVSGDNLTYQWQKDGSDLVNNSTFAGVTTNTLSVSNATPAQNGSYVCQISGACNDANTNPATLVVNPSTTITQNPVNKSLCIGDQLDLTVIAQGSNLSYQWYHGSTAIGINSSNYSKLGVVSADAGTYSCVVTGNCGTITSTSATVTVYDNTTISSSPGNVTLCENNSTTLSVVAAGGNLIYQWKKNSSNLSNGSNISGVTTPNLNISNAFLADAGIYSCSISGSCGSSANSSAASVIVNPLTKINTHPANYTRCVGEDVTFTVGASGSGLTYQWRRNGVDIASATNAVYSINGLILNHAGSYTCLVSGSCGSVISNPAVLTVNNPAAIATQPSSVTICQGASTNLSVIAVGTGLTYQWFKNTIAMTDNGNYSGTTTNQLVISNALLTDGGSYSCLITGTCNDVTTQPALVTIQPTTIVTKNPSDMSRCAGHNAFFDVQASGVGLSYQWQLNNTDLPGETHEFLILNNISASSQGAYHCVVTGTCSSAVSNPGTLTVIPSADFSLEPVNQQVCEDNVATFNVIADGQNVTYQWSFNGNPLSNNSIISGALSPILVINPATETNEGLYRCSINSTCGQDFSNMVQLTVNDSLKINSHPISQTVTSGSNAFFSVGAVGNITQYQWKKNGNALTDGGNISGSNSALLTISNTGIGDEGIYLCEIVSQCGTKVSNSASLTVNVPVVITVEPVDLTVCEGQAASFSTTATGTNLTYQWYYNSNPITDGGVVSGATTPNLVISPASKSNRGRYSCQITGSYGTASSRGVALMINQTVSISLQPLSQWKCENDQLILEVNSTGNSLTYQWEKDNLALVDGGDISGVSQSVLIVSNLDVTDIGNYRCLVSNTCNSVYSNPANIDIISGVNITQSPSNLSICLGRTANFSLIATGDSLTYQWYLGNTPLVNSSRILGAQSANLVINNTTLNDAGNYSCRVDGPCTFKKSNVGILTVNPETQIQNQPSNLTICEGTDGFFEVSAQGSNLNYQWQKDGVDLVDGASVFGSATSVLMINDAATSNQGIYRCMVTGDCQSELSNPANLIVNQYPVAAGTITGTTTVCQGDEKILYVVPAIAFATSYVWDLPYGASIISGEGTRSIQVEYASNSISGTVTVSGQNGCGLGTPSSALAVTVNQLPSAIAGDDQLICGTTATLSANPVNGVWSILSGDAIISSPNDFNSGITDLQKGKNQFIWTVTANGCTAIDTIAITNTTLLVNAGTDEVVCSRNATLHAFAPFVGASWSIISGSGLIDQVNSTITSVTGLSQGANEFRWSIINQGCESYDAVIITNNIPLPPRAGGDQTIDADQATLDADEPETGTTGSWSVASGSGTFNDVNDPNTTITGLSVGVNQLVWKVQRQNCTLTDTLIVENIMIESPDAGSNQTLCTSSTTLDASPVYIGTGEWSVISGAATFVDKFKYNTRINNIGLGNNWLRWTVRTSAQGVKSDSTLIINNQTTVSNAGPDVSLCIDTFNLQANVPIIGTGYWTVNSGSGTILQFDDANSLVRDLGQGINELQWTITHENCISTDYVSIINNTPTVANAGPDQTICDDSTLLTPNTPAIGKGSWSIVSGSATFNVNIVTQLAPDKNVLRYTITNKTCKSNDDIIIINNKPTTPQAGYDKSICVDQVILEGNKPQQGTGEWSVISGSGTFSNIAINNPTVTNISLGINIYRWTINKNNCIEQDEVKITDNFIKANAGGDINLCQDNYQMQASNPSPGEGLWSIIGASGASFDSQSDPVTTVRNLSKGINRLRWTVNNQGCISIDTVSVANYQPSDAFAGEDQSLCATTTKLNANIPGFGTGTWLVMEGTASFTSPSNAKTNVSQLGVGSNRLRWRITQQNCETYDEVIITNNLPANVFAGNDQSVCSDTTNLFATAPTIGNGRWSIVSGSGTFDNSTDHLTTVRKLGKGKNVFKWEVTSADCHVTDTVIITSSIPTKAIAGADQILCEDQSILGGNTPAIGTGRWVMVSGSLVIESPTSPVSTISSISRGTTILQWTIDLNGCISTDELVITNNQPSQPYAGVDRDLCGDSTRLFADPVTIGSGYWTLASGDAVIVSQNENQTVVRNIQFGPNTFRWVVTNLNCVMYDDVVITCNYAYADAGQDRDVQSPLVQLIGNNPSSGQGLWSLEAGSGIIQTPQLFETWVNGLGAGANVFRWSITNEGCTAYDDVKINYIVMPVPGFNPDKVDGCLPMIVNFVNTSIGGAPYKWDFGDGEFSSEPNIIHEYKAPGIYVASLTATAPMGITLTKDTIITVHTNPIADFDIAPRTIYIPDEHISCFNYSIDADTSTWYFGDGNSITQLAPTYVYNKEGTYDITLKVVSSYGCVDTMVKSQVVNVIQRSSFLFPEAFTPNPTGGSGGSYNPQDRSNDVFYPIIIDGELLEMEFIVYNRDGVIVFKSNDPNIGWDGYYKGKLLPQDVYIYSISGKYNSGLPFHQIGNVLLILKDN